MGITSQFALRVRGVTSREEFDEVEQSVKRAVNSAARSPYGKTFAKEGQSYIVTLSFADPSEKRHFLKALKAQLVDGLKTWTATDSFDGLTVLTSPLEPEIESVNHALDNTKFINSVR